MRRTTLALLLFVFSLPLLAQTVEKGETFKNGDVTIYYEVRGVGIGTPLIVVNGGPGSDHNYLHVSDSWDLLAKNRRVVFYDQRGNGRSGALPPDASCTLADQIADLDALREHLHLEKADFLGHSWGGYLVMAYAARHPERVENLVICDSAAPKLSDTVFLFKDIFPDVMARWDATAFADEMGDSVASDIGIREWHSTLFYATANRDVFLKNASEYHYDKAINQKLNADLARFDLNPELPKFKFPALVLTGRYDIAVAPSVAWKISKAIPGSKLVIFEKSGHLPFFEERDAFVSVVEDFLK